MAKFTALTMTIKQKQRLIELLKREVAVGLSLDESRECRKLEHLYRNRPTIQVGDEVYDVTSWSVTTKQD